MEKRRYELCTRRIEGQVHGIDRTIEGEEYCIGVLIQISAVNSALKSLALALPDAYLHHCMVHTAESSQEELDAKLERASAAVAHSAR